jgi:hypothetical protein
MSRGDGRVEISLKSPASAGLFRFRARPGVMVVGLCFFVARELVGFARAGLGRQSR